MSYYHEEDQQYRERFETLFSKYYDIMVSESVEIGDINPNLKTETIYQKIRDDYLRNSTVTVVLVGAHTWQRKFVDWEIGSSIRQTEYNSRSGLLGILLPTFCAFVSRQRGLYNSPLSEVLHKALGLNDMPLQARTDYDPYKIPPRLHDNIECGFAKIYYWNEFPNIVQSWIHEAFEQRTKINPNNKRLMFKNNRTTERWSQ